MQKGENTAQASLLAIFKIAEENSVELTSPELGLIDALVDFTFSRYSRT